MIVYRRQLTEDDISQLKKDEQLIYYYNNNIAFTVNNNVGEYVLRKRLIYEHFCATLIFVNVRDIITIS